LIKLIFGDSYPTLIIGSANDKIEDILRKMSTHQLISLPISSGAKDIEIIGRVSLFEIMQYFYQSSYETAKLDKPILKVLQFTEFYLQKKRPGLEFGFPFVLKKNLSESLTIDSLFYPFSIGLHIILVEILDKDYVNLSQSDVVRFLYYQNLLPSKSQMHMIGGISYIAHMSKEILVVEETENVVQAYLMLSSTFQTAAAVVNEEGVLVSTLSSTDLRNLTLELLGEMRQMSVRKFLLHTKNEKDYRSPVCLVTEESTLIEIVRQIVEFRVHRVWIVDNEQKPFGVISLSDIFRVLARYNKKLDLLDKLEPKIDLHKVNKKFEEKDEEENLEKKIETKNSEFEEKMIENTYNLGDEDYYLNVIV